MTTQKTSSINVNDTLNKLDNVITKYLGKVYSHYKVLDPNAKSIGLTYSGKFNDVLKKMKEEDKNCRMLNALLPDNEGMKIKASYLADKNINALNLERNEDGKVSISYTDLRADLTKELGYIKSYSKLDEQIGFTKDYIKWIREKFDYIFVTTTTDETKRNLFISDTVGPSMRENISHIKNKYMQRIDHFILWPVREKIPNGSGRNNLIGNYISANRNITWEVDRMVRFLKDFSYFITICIIPEDKALKYFGENYKDIVEVIEKHFINNGIMYDMLESIVYYYLNAAEKYLEILNNIKDYKIEEYIEVIKKNNSDITLEYLVVSESFLNFLNKLIYIDNEILLKAKKWDYMLNGRDKGPKLSGILRGRGFLNYSFDCMVHAFDVRSNFNKQLGIYGNGTFENLLNESYKHFLQQLYKGKTYRQIIKPGKISSKLFNGHYSPVEVDQFVKIFEKNTSEVGSKYKVRIVEGKLITYYYNDRMYSQRSEILKKIDILETEENRPQLVGGVVDVVDNEMRAGGGSLYGSCMRYPYCYDQILTYANNPETIKLQIALDEDNKLAARAVLWYHPDGRVFIDRVYAMNEKARVDMFRWAEKKGFISINTQNTTYSNKLKFDIEKEGVVFAVSNAIDNIPYFDTAQRLDHQGIIGLGKYTNQQKADAYKRLAELQANKVKKATENVQPVLDLAYRKPSASIVKAFKKKTPKKSYEFSKDYDFKILASTHTKKVVNDIGYYSIYHGLITTTYEIHLMLDFQKAGKKPESFKPMLPKVVTLKEAKDWKKQKIENKLNMMQFLGAKNYRNAA